MRILLQLVKVFQKIYRFRVDIFQILNNVRILIIPVVNMNGFYNSTDNATAFINGEYYDVDPKFDFNLVQKDKCFTSFSSQIIYKIYEKYLIFGTFLFSKGDFTISIPQLSKVCLLYTSPSPRDGLLSRMPSSA